MIWSYRAAVTVLILAVHHMSGSSIFPPYQLVKKVIESWYETELSQHLMDLCRGTRQRFKTNLHRSFDKVRERC